MKKHLTKSLSIVFVLMLVLSCLFVPMMTASAAVVTDGTNFYNAGDPNADGTVDICDLVAAANGLGDTVASDLDGDGTAGGSYDLALIRAMILGIDKSQWTE